MSGTFFNLMVITGLSWRYCSSQAICSMDDSTVRTARRVTSVAAGKRRHQVHVDLFTGDLGDPFAAEVRVDVVLQV